MALAHVTGVITTVAESVKNRMIQRSHIASSKISVIYNAVQMKNLILMLIRQR